MTRAWILYAALIVAATMSAVAFQQRPVFRLETAIVSVDVSVLGRNRPVTGLTAADFSLTDNGVAQVIESVTVESMPVDVSVVLDVAPGADSQWVEQFRNDLRGIGQTLRPVDRLEIVAFADDVGFLPLQAAHDPASIDALIRRQVAAAASGVRQSGVLDRAAGTRYVQLQHGAMTYDAIALALMRPTSPDRRRLIVAFVGGTDCHSLVSFDELQRAAARVDGVLHVVRPPWRPVPLLNQPDHLSRTGRLWPVLSSELLDKLADATGGDTHVVNDAYLPSRPPEPRESGANPGSFTTNFGRIFEHYRQSYVLRYRPAGVLPSGWHDIVVKVRRDGRFDVRARKGYDAGRGP